AKADEFATPYIARLATTMTKAAPARTGDSPADARRIRARRTGRPVGRTLRSLRVALTGAGPPRADAGRSGRRVAPGRGRRPAGRRRRSRSHPRPASWGRG